VRISVDHDKCIGIGICEGLAPAVFEVREDGTLALREEHPTAGLDSVHEAAQGCPTGAITLHDDHE